MIASNSGGIDGCSFAFRRTPGGSRLLGGRVRRRHWRIRGHRSRPSPRVPIAPGADADPERCLEAYHLYRTRLELVAERKVRRRQLTDDGNVEITGRDLCEREHRVLAGQSDFARAAR